MYTQTSVYTNKHVNEKCHIWLLFVISSMKLYLSSFTHNSSRLSFRSLPICIPIPLILPCEKRPASDQLPLNCIKKSIAYMDWNIFSELSYFYLNQRKKSTTRFWLRYIYQFLDIFPTYIHAKTWWRSSSRRHFEIQYCTLYFDLNSTCVHAYIPNGQMNNKLAPVQIMDSH